MHVALIQTQQESLRCSQRALDQIPSLTCLPKSEFPGDFQIETATLQSQHPRNCFSAAGNSLPRSSLVAICWGSGAELTVLRPPAACHAHRVFSKRRLPMLPGSRLVAVEEPCLRLGSVSLQVRRLIERPVSKKQLLGFVMSEGWNPLSDN